MNHNQHTTTGIVLARTNYGEADRIITFMTPDQGKLRLIAKGVRRVKSKLAGGVELFSVSNLTFIRGRGDIGTLVSARLLTHYGHIVQTIERTMLGYELIKKLHKATEDEPEPAYFELLHQAFMALDDDTISRDLIDLWFQAQLLRLGGHTPNLTHQADGTKLQAGQMYEFDFDDSVFLKKTDGTFATDDIKFLRLLFSGSQPAILGNIGRSSQLAEHAQQLVKFMSQQYIQY